MRAEIAVLDLQLRRRALLSYLVGMALYALVIVALYRQFKDPTSLDRLTKNAASRSPRRWTTPTSRPYPPQTARIPGRAPLR